MNLLAAILIGWGFLAWFGPPNWRKLWIWPWAGLMLGWIAMPHMNTALILVSIAAILGVMSRSRPLSKNTILQRRVELVRFWRLCAVYLSAGLTFWQAVDVALSEKSRVSPSVRQMFAGLPYPGRTGEAVEQFRQHNPGPEGELISTMMLHASRHGLAAEDALVQAEQMEERLQLEIEMSRQKDPLWMTVIPAILLVNVLAMFVAPMSAMFQHGHFTF